MRNKNHIHIRHIMLYHFEKEWKASASFRDINEIFGEGTISERQCREWFARFKSGDTSLEDKPGRGRPSDFDDNALLAAVEEDENVTTRLLAESFGVDHSTIVRRLRKLGKVWKLAGWVPHELSDKNKADRVQIFTELLRRNQEAPFLENLVTGDESWLLFKNVQRKKVCVSPGVSPKGIPKNVHCNKVMWCVWWDKSGIIHWEIMSKGFCYWWNDDDERQRWRIPDKDGKRQFNLNSDVYLAQLVRLHAAIQTKRPRKMNQIIFHHDNARPHIERRVVEFIANNGWDKIPHPPYSPTEAPTDYHVNRSLKNWQSNKIYDDFDELTGDVKKWIASKNRDFFARGIDRLPGKWEAVIDVGGEYAPE